MPITYVNIHGEVINPAAGAAKAKPKASRSSDSYHKGFMATGFSPEQLERARIEHEKQATGKPFIEAAYMAKARPTKIRSKPYEIAEAASQAVAMAEKSGWKNCRVIPVAKGVA